MRRRRGSRKAKARAAVTLRDARLRVHGAVTRIVTVEDEKDWLNIAMNSTASQLEKTVRCCRRANRTDELAEEEARHQARYLNTYFDDDGMLVVEGRLSPEAGAVVSKALEAAYQELCGEQQGTTGDDAAKADFQQLRADALERLAERALGNGEPKSNADHRQIVVHVDVETLVDPSAAGRSEIEDGEAISAETARRIACDANLSHWDGEVPDYDWITTVMTDRRRSRTEEFLAVGSAS